MDKDLKQVLTSIGIGAGVIAVAVIIGVGVVMYKNYLEIDLLKL